jgi:hypothetical protein
MAEADTVDAIQPDRYVENEDFAPDPTAQYGVALTSGNVNPIDSLEYTTPLYREMRGGSDMSDDEYFLTPGQRAAALTEEEAQAAAEEQSQAAADEQAAAAEENTPAEPEPAAPNTTPEDAPSV